MTSDLDRLRRISESDYDSYADTYDLAFDNVVDDLDMWLAFATGRQRVCDMGCGTGRVTRMVASKASVVGIDPSRSMLDRARARVPDSVELRVGRLEEIPATDQEFDLVMCPRGSFSHIATLQGQEAAVRELSRITCPGATVVIDIPHFGVSHPLLADYVDLCEVSRVTKPGRTITFYQESTFEPATRVLRAVHYAMEQFDDARPPVVHQIDLSTKVLTPAELVFLFTPAFKVLDVFGDYDRGPVEAESPRVILAVTRRD